MRTPDPVVMREAIRQTERMLAMQGEVRESILRRAGELLRLDVATLGAVIIITGVLSATSVRITPLAFVGFLSAVVVQLFATGILASLLAGSKMIGAFAFGPDPRLLADHLLRDSVTEAGYLVSMIETQPDWAEENNRLLVRLQRRNAAAVGTLALGVLILVVTLSFIAGGHILA